MTKHASKFARNRRILDLLRAGISTRQIGHGFGLTRERVRQIGLDAGVRVCFQAPPRAERTPVGPAIRKPLPPRERLLDLFDYRAETGDLVWRATGRIAGSSCAPYGRVRITIDQVQFVAHRLIWLYVHGEPVPHEIDHRDGSEANNRIDNLRAATHAQNGANSRRYRQNTTGYKGVSFVQREGNYRASIMREGKVYRLGSFPTAQAAHTAYATEARRMSGAFARTE
jgi:hypothetical protein